MQLKLNFNVFLRCGKYMQFPVSPCIQIKQEKIHMNLLYEEILLLKRCTENIKNIVKLVVFTEFDIYYKFNEKF